MTTADLRDLRERIERARRVAAEFKALARRDRGRPENIRAWRAPR